MRSRTDYSMKLWLLTAAVLLAVIPAKGQVNQNNPSQHVAIAEGNIKIDNTINDEIDSEKKTLAFQGAMSKEWNDIKTWQKKYNEYLTKTRGYAEAIQAATTLYAEGVKSLRNLYDLTKAARANPQGIAASLAMNNLYVEVTSEMVKTYRILNKSIKEGGNGNMLTGAERTELLWWIEDCMEQLNRKLRQLAVSIAFYNMTDVWHQATAGLVDRSHGEIAEDALDRWKRAQRVQQILE